MRFPKLNNQQLSELAKLCFDIGKAIFLGSVGGFFIPSLVGKDVSPTTLVIGIFASLTFIITGVILLRDRR